MAASILTDTKALIPPSLPILATGKVRDLYALDASKLLFVATDRISAHDVTMANGIPKKGRLLTLLTAHWIRLIQEKLPHIPTHFVTLDLPDVIPESSRSALQDRSCVVRRCKVLPLEAIVRGYLTGSAWTEYHQYGTVHGIPVPPGLRESEALPEPLFTPSTKAPPGEHDENITPARAAEIVGADYARRIGELAVSIYAMARDYAAERGIIIADTKFEFGLNDAGDIVLVDEVLTPDSSRFWSARDYAVGRAQSSLDKQGLRDWLVKDGLKGESGVVMPDDVVQATAAKYQEAYEKLVGTPFA